MILTSMILTVALVGTLIFAGYLLALTRPSLRELVIKKKEVKTWYIVLIAAVSNELFSIYIATINDPANFGIQLAKNGKYGLYVLMLILVILAANKRTSKLLK